MHIYNKHRIGLGPRHVTLPARCLSCARVVKVLQLNAAKRITINISSYSVTETNQIIRLSVFYSLHVR